jgi:hypothetical protein
MSVANEAWEIWRQADDLIAGLEQADYPSEEQWAEHCNDVILLLKGWRNRLRRIGRMAGDIDEVTQRQWRFPDGPDDE